MFKNLRTSTKLFILWCVFIVSIGVATYGLVAEKKIAIDFARKELVGTKYLAAVRAIFAAILTDRANPAPIGQPKVSADNRSSADELVGALDAAQSAAGAMLQTAELEQALAATLRELQSNKADGPGRDALVADAIVKARRLAVRIGDDSNLTLDPDLDTYYVQDIVVGKLPTFLGHLGEGQRLLREAAAAPTVGHGVRIVMLDSLLRSTTEAIETNLAAAYRGNVDGKLKPAVEANFVRMISDANSHLSRVKSIVAAGQPTAIDAPSPDPVFANAVQSAIDAWTVSHSELDRLLQQRIDTLLGKLRLSLMFIGLATCLSIFIAFMTYWHIVRPLQRLEKLARTVRETKDYSLRTDIRSHDEIGRLAVAFNDMLSELAKAREREVADQARAGAVQSELARVTRLTTMGEMAATVAHEINQPLAAIVANGNAGLRWLKNKMPDLEEVEQSLKRIVKDGHRAGETIRSIRGMLRKTSQAKMPLDVNELVRGVIALAHNELAKHRVQVQTALSPGLPPVLADRAQLQQVMWNLIVNAAESMDSVVDRARILKVRSEMHDDANVLLTVEDSGIGIAPQDHNRIFEAFFTTKSSGIGMGLSICRSIVEAHGGSLSVSAGKPHGSIFRVVLPMAAHTTKDERQQLERAP
jgi:signal transduction histidine kinase